MIKNGLIINGKVYMYEFMRNGSNNACDDCDLEQFCKSLDEPCPCDNLFGQEGTKCFHTVKNKKSVKKLLEWLNSLPDEDSIESMSNSDSHTNEVIQYPTMDDLANNPDVKVEYSCPDLTLNEECKANLVINKSNMQNVYEELKEKISKMTPEEIQKEWEELKQYNEVGPTVDEYIQQMKSLDPEISKIVDDNFFDLI